MRVLGWTWGAETQASWTRDEKRKETYTFLALSRLLAVAAQSFPVSVRRKVDNWIQIEGTWSQGTSWSKMQKKKKTWGRRQTLHTFLSMRSSRVSARVGGGASRGSWEQEGWQWWEDGENSQEQPIKKYKHLGHTLLHVHTRPHKHGQFPGQWRQGNSPDQSVVPKKPWSADQCNLWTVTGLWQEKQKNWDEICRQHLQQPNRAVLRSLNLEVWFSLTLYSLKVLEKIKQSSSIYQEHWSAVLYHITLWVSQYSFSITDRNRDQDWSKRSWQCRGWG